MPECRHLSIQTYTFDEGEPALWACNDCRLRFYPACKKCISVGHRGVEHITLDEGVDGVDCDWDERGKCRCLAATPAPLAECCYTRSAGLTCVYHAANPATPAPLDWPLLLVAVRAFQRRESDASLFSHDFDAAYVLGQELEAAGVTLAATPAPLDVLVAARAVVDAWEETVTATVISRTNWAIERLRYALAATPAPLMSKGEADARIDLMKMTKQRDDLLEALAATPAPLDVDRAAPFGDRISADLAQEASPLYDPEYMCPNCVTPWKCNGPHIPEE